MLCENRRYEKQATGIKKCGKKGTCHKYYIDGFLTKKGIPFNEHNEIIQGWTLWLMTIIIIKKTITVFLGNKINVIV